MSTGPQYEGQSAQVLAGDGERLRVDVGEAAGLLAGDMDTEIACAQGGVRAWVLRSATAGGHSLREVSAPVVTSLLCGAAFAPLVAAAAGGADQAGMAGISVLSSVGGGVLSRVIAAAIDRLRSLSGRDEPGDSGDGTEAGRKRHAGELAEAEIAREIGRMLAAGDTSAQALLAEIAGVLAEIDAGGVMIRAAIETGSEQVLQEVTAAVGTLGAGFAELKFLVGDVARAAAEIQESLDRQGADARVIIEQNRRQSAEIRLVRQDLAVIERRTRGGPKGAVAGQGKRWGDGCPYRGLLPFGEADAEVFYGRERLKTELAVSVARRVSSGGLVVVTGASGAGKSSLLRAGLLPALARGVLVQGSERWPRMVITPGRDPLAELAVGLAALGGGDAAAVHDSLGRRPDQAHLAIRQALAADADRCGLESPPGERMQRLVLVVDQFEQIFTLNPGPDGEAGRQAFITVLCAAAGSGGGAPALVVIAVRGDFWDRCAAYPELAAALQEGQFIVGPMTEPDLRLAITGPAEEAGLHMDESLPGTVISDLREAGSTVAVGVLPLLSQAMMLTWENRDGDRLTIRGYEQAGGIRLAVQASADAICDSLTARQRALTPDLLRAMIVVGRDGRMTRRPVNRADLHGTHPDADWPAIDGVLEAFAARRLMVLDGGTAQLAHDALLAAWPRLRGWLDEDQASWILHSQLTEDATAWRDRHDDPSFLYRGTQLAALRQATAGWAQSPARYPALTGTERDFMTASERAAARAARRQLTAAATLALLLAAALVLAGLTAKADRSVTQQRNLAQADQMAAEASNLFATNDPLAMLLSLQGYKLAQTKQTTSAVIEAAGQPLKGVLTQCSQVSSVAFSPDGPMIAAGDLGGDVELWNTATGKQTAVLHEGGVVSGVAFSPDGRTVATADYSGFVGLWNTATGKQTAVLHEGAEVSSVAFSPDGQTLIAGDSSGDVGLWNIATGKQVTVLHEGSQVDAVAFSRDGRTVAAADLDGDVGLWNIATGKQTAVLHEGGMISDVAFSPDGRIVAAGDYSGDVGLWNIATGKQTAVLHEGSQVKTVAFSPDGRAVAVGDLGGDVGLWNITTGKQVAVLHEGSQVNAVAFSSDGRTLVAGDLGGDVALWDTAVLTQGNPANAVAFSRDGRAVAVGDGSGDVGLWNTVTGKQIAVLHEGSQVNAVALSPDGRTAAAGDYSGDAGLWNTATGKQTAALHEGDIDYAVAFSPDGPTAVVGNYSGNIGLWNIATGKQTAVLHEGNTVNTVAFSPDGRTVAAGDYIGDVGLWNTVTGKQIAALHEGSQVNAVAFSSDGQTVAAGDLGGDVGLWNAVTGKQTAVLHEGNTVNAVAFSPDGRTVAVGDGSGDVGLWNTATADQIAVLHENGAVYAVAFSPDGQAVAVGDNSDVVLIRPNLSNLTYESFSHLICAKVRENMTNAQWEANVPGRPPYQNTCPGY